MPTRTWPVTISDDRLLLATTTALVSGTLLAIESGSKPSGSPQLTTQAPNPRRTWLQTKKRIVDDKNRRLPFRGLLATKRPNDSHTAAKLSAATVAAPTR